MGQSSGRLSSGRSISVISGPPAVILHAAVTGASIQFVPASQKHEPVFVIAVRAASAHSSAAQPTLQPISAGAAAATALSHSSVVISPPAGQASVGSSSAAAASVTSLLPSSSVPPSQPSASTAGLASSTLAGAAGPPSASASLLPPLSLSLASPTGPVSSLLSVSPAVAVSELTFELVRRYTAFDRLYHSLRALQPVHQQHVSHVPAHPDPNGPTFLADMSVMLSAWMANLLNNPTLARQTVTILFFTQQDFNTLPPPHSQLLHLADQKKAEHAMMDDDEGSDDEDGEAEDDEDDEEDQRRQQAGRRNEADVAEAADELMTDADTQHSALHARLRPYTDGHSQLPDEDGTGEGADVVADISLAQMRGEMGSPTLAPLYERTPSISSTLQYGQTDEQRHDDLTTTQRSHSHSHSSVRTHTAHSTTTWHTHDAAAQQAQQQQQQYWQPSSQAHTAPHHGHLHQLHATSHSSHHAHLTTRADAGWTPPALQLTQHSISPPALGLQATLLASSPRSASSSSSSASPTMYLPPPALRASYDQQQQQQHTPQLSPAGHPHRSLTASSAAHGNQQHQQQHYQQHQPSQHQQHHHHHHHHSLYSPQPAPVVSTTVAEGTTEAAGNVTLTSPASSTSSSSHSSSQSPALLAHGLSSPAAGRAFMSIAPSRSSFSFSPSHSHRSLSYNTASAASPHTNPQHEQGGSSPQPSQPALLASRHSSSSSGSPSSRTGAVRLRDFHLLKVIGKGSFGKVLLVRKRDTDAVYAMKVLHKVNVIKRNQVEHTMTERSVLEYIRHPFIVALRYAFQTKHKLYFVLDYMPGQPSHSCRTDELRQAPLGLSQLDAHWSLCVCVCIRCVS